MAFKNFKHCKIVGTIGPSSANEKTIEELIQAGLNIARLNFSHGTHEVHLKTLQMIRRVSLRLNKTVGILQDLQGPKIRCGQLLEPMINIKKNQVYKLEFGLKQTAADIIPIDYDGLAKDVEVGHKILMDDGLLIFEILEINGKVVVAEAKENGVLKARKGVNFPDSKISLPALTEKDRKDLLFGISHHVDIVALSFVQSVNDIYEIKHVIESLEASTPVIAKIEKKSAVKNIEEIAAVADGLMVARGDLGVESGVEKVPLAQRMMLDQGARMGKPVIIATQMLESMISNPVATQAEVSDVANGVLEGADCLMLSGEVASGNYPVQCVEKMGSIIKKVENWNLKKELQTRSYIFDRRVNFQWEDHEAIARAACDTAKNLSAAAIVCLTLTGSIAKTIAKWRPQTPIVAISPKKEVVNRLAMVWGIVPILNPEFYQTEVMLDRLPKFLKETGLFESGELIVMTAGIPMKSMNPTNTIKVGKIP